MNMTPRTGLSHPLVVAYLNDLERALALADAQERIDTIAAVTEHLTDALGGDAEPTSEQVRAVLDELGSVEQIAASATPASTLPAEQKQEGGWVAPALLATSIVSLLVPLFGAPLAIGCLVTAVVLLRNGAPRHHLLRATVAISSITLVINAVLFAGSLAWATVTVSDSTVSSSAAVESIPSQP